MKAPHERTRPRPAVGLTGQEAECLELAGTLAGRLYNLPTLHETDWHDLVHAIHIVQNRPLARPAYRKYLQLAAGARQARQVSRRRRSNR